MFRFTKDTIPKVLALNEGFQRRKYFDSKNLKYENVYTIKNGQLERRSEGKTSWGGSQFDETEICDYETTQRFLRDHKDYLNLDI